MNKGVTFSLVAQGARGLRPCSARPLHLEQLPFGFIARGVRHDPIAISYISYETAGLRCGPALPRNPIALDSFYIQIGRGVRALGRSTTRCSFFINIFQHQVSFGSGDEPTLFQFLTFWLFRDHSRGMFTLMDFTRFMVMGAVKRQGAGAAPIRDPINIRHSGERVLLDLILTICWFCDLHC